MPLWPRPVTLGRPLQSLNTETTEVLSDLCVKLFLATEETDTLREKIFVAQQGPKYWRHTEIPICNRQSKIGNHYSGMFPCFLGGLVSRLFSSMRKAVISLGRVSQGWMTSSTQPRSAAM